MSYIDGNIVAADASGREARQRRLIRAQMCSDRLPQQDIIIRNLSPRGIGGASRGLPPMQDEKVAVLLPDGQNITGWISWIDGQSFGIKLDRDLDLQSLAASIQRINELTDASTTWEVKRLHRVTTPRVDTSKLRKVRSTEFEGHTNHEGAPIQPSKDNLVSPEAQDLAIVSLCACS